MTAAARISPPRAASSARASPPAPSAGRWAAPSPSPGPTPTRFTARPAVSTGPEGLPCELVDVKVECELLGEGADGHFDLDQLLKLAALACEWQRMFAT